MESVTIGPRFNGLPDVPLGGYVAGLLARGRPSAEVVLRRPAKLGATYQVAESSDGSARLLEGETEVAMVREARLDLEVPTIVHLKDAIDASRSYPGFRRHLFPTCFTCGPARAEGDGLRIFPGVVPGSRVVAAPWDPFPSLGDVGGKVSSEFVWSAMDCPSIWALILDPLPEMGGRWVTSRLAVEQRASIAVGERHVVVAWRLAGGENRRVGAAAVISSSGRAVALGRHTLVPVSWGFPLTREGWT